MHDDQAGTSCSCACLCKILQCGTDLIPQLQHALRRLRLCMLQWDLDDSLYPGYMIAIYIARGIRTQLQVPAVPVAMHMAYVSRAELELDRGIYTTQVY